MCTFLSATYHTISCHSYAVFEKFLALDVAGVALAIYAIFISGIYYREAVWGMFLAMLLILNLDKQINFGSI